MHPYEMLVWQHPQRKGGVYFLVHCSEAAVISSNNKASETPRPGLETLTQGEIPQQQLAQRVLQGSADVLRAGGTSGSPFSLNQMQKKLSSVLRRAQPSCPEAPSGSSSVVIVQEPQLDSTGNPHLGI